MVIEKTVTYTCILYMYVKKKKKIPKFAKKNVIAIMAIFFFLKKKVVNCTAVATRNFA